jgi:flavin-dependent dehydrogenase
MLKTGKGEFDALVVGAGPSGATAATWLAQKGHRVCLIDKDKLPKRGVTIGWLNARAAPLLAELKLPTKPFLDHAIREVTFHNADFTKVAKPNIRNAPGYLIDRTALNNALVAAAKNAGVVLTDGHGVDHVQLGESGVSLGLSGDISRNGKLLILAAGRESPLLEGVGIPKNPRGTPIGCAQAEGPHGSPRRDSAVAVVLGLDRRGSFGLCCLQPGWCSIAVNFFGESDRTLPMLMELCRSAFAHGVVPVDLSDAATKASAIASPASAALDMETHVAKHTLVIGDAGGFVSAASNEGLYPAMWSARIAAEVMDAALRAAKKRAPTQDELMTFNSKWRVEMADYLRAPHTDIQFLLPLIFSNQPMADRMAAAFFSGEKF